MAKKTTLETLAEQLAKIDARMTKGFASLSTRIDKLNNRVENVDARMQRGFAAVADDGNIKRDMASKGQIITLHTQITAIEGDIRSTKQARLVTRVADLEEKVFGRARG
jgi:CTP-dependent riboflavin kinase